MGKSQQIIDLDYLVLHTRDRRLGVRRKQGTASDEAYVKIRRYVAKYGRFPSTGIIGEMMGYSNRSSASDLLKRMHRNGMLRLTEDSLTPETGRIYRRKYALVDSFED